MNPKTLIEAVQHFADLGACQEYLLKIKYPDGKIVCPKCASDNVGQIKTRHLLKCRACNKQFSAKLGTIFEDSPLPLSHWFTAVWCAANFKMGISSCELARSLGVTQKTAWFMLHRIRLAMHTGTFRKMSGVVETDETFVGGRAENMHKKVREKRIKGRGSVGKSIVHGLLERNTDPKAQDSQVRCTVVPDTERSTLLTLVAANVEPHTVVCTDAHASYGGMPPQFLRRFIDHATAYAVGKVHVNGMENFWSLLKRMLKGTYVAVAPFHLFRYLDEEIYRFNERRWGDGDRFHQVMRGVVGRRITYRVLCGIDGAGFMGLA